MSRIHTPSAAVLLFVLLSVLAAAVYLPGLSGDYVFDDLPNVLDNKRLQIHSLDPAAIEGAALSSDSGVLRRPISMLSFALNRYFFGVSPYSFKVTNLVIHLLTGLGLFLLSRLLLRGYRLYRRPDLSEAAATWLPVIVSGLWLVHPLNLTAVLYIVQRMTSLASLFMVCGLCLYVAGRLKMVEHRRGLPWVLAGLLAFGTLAIFSKETGALLPLYMLVVETALFRFRRGDGAPDKAVIAFFLATVAVPGCLTLVYLAMDPAAFLGGYGGRSFTLTERLLTESRVLVFYLKMIIMPSIKALGLYHDDIAVSHGLLDPPTTLYSLSALVGLLLGGLLALKKRPLIALGILWFFTGHVLESTVLPLEIAHEHRNYLADYGILLAAASAIAEAPLRRFAPVIRTAVPLLFLLLFSTTTWLRASQWSSNINQSIYAARHHPDSYRSTYAAGRIYARLAVQGQPGSEEKAYAYLEHAARMNTISIMPEAAMIKLSYVLKQPVKRAWFDSMANKLMHKPLTASDLSALQELTRCADAKCAIPPDTMEAIFHAAMRHKNAILLSIYGYYSINHRGDFRKGLDLFNRAVELSPEQPQLWINLIKLLIAMRRPDQAEERLMQFMNATTYGGNADDYRRLQASIDALRKSQSTMTQTINPGNG